MGDITKGKTFADGDTVHGTDLNDLVDQATLKINAITDRTASSSLSSGDLLLVYDASDAALRSVTYAILSAAILNGATTPASRKAYAQATHGFAVGDVIYRAKATANFVKATAHYLQQTFAVGDVDTTNDRITLPAGTVTALTNADKVFVTTGTTMPTGLVTSKYYYVSKFDATHIELYTEVGLVNKVDITSVGAGAHTLHYGLPLWNAIGVVDTVTDANNFTVTFRGEVTTLAGLTDGVVYYLSSTSAGAATATPPTGEGTLVIPVYCAISATSAIVGGAGSGEPSAKSVRNDHLADQSVNRRTVDASLLQTIDRNIGADRQMVLAGGTDANGYANFLSSSAGLTVDLDATTPVIISFANGFDDTNGYNFVEKISSNAQWAGLPASTEAVFLYADRNSGTGAISYSYTTNPPEYGFAKTNYRDRGCIPALTSNAGNADYIVSASTQSGAQLAFKAFNKTLGGTSYWQATAVPAQWLQCAFTTARAINSVSFCMTANGGTEAPSSITVQGGDDGATWPFNSGALAVGVWTVPQSQVITFPNQTSYKYWRVNITTAAAAPVVWEMNLHEAIDHYYVIPEAKMYAYSGGAWSQVSRVFIGECKTGAASVAGADIKTYAIRGLWISNVFQVDPSSNYTKIHQIGTDKIKCSPELRMSASFPWPDNAFSESFGPSGMGITRGQSDQDPKGDRNIITISTGTKLLRGDVSVPAKYSDSQENPATHFGQGRVIVRRAF